MGEPKKIGLAADVENILHRYPSQPAEVYVVTLPADFKPGTPVYLDVFGWIRTVDEAKAVGTWRKTA